MNARRLARLVELIAACSMLGTLLADGLPARAVSMSVPAPSAIRASAPPAPASATFTPPPTLLATPIPAATPLPTPTVQPTLLPAPPSLPATATPDPRSVLIGAGVDTEVTTYSDCTATSPLPRSEAAIYACATWDTYFLGHNPGVFTPLLSAQNGIGEK